MNVTNNSWFDENYYLNSKLIELQQSGQTQYTSTVQVYNAIVAAGYTPLTHFEAFSLDENTSPSQYFNTFEYLEAKAAQLNATQGVTTWTASNTAVALANAGFTNAYDHYAAYGWTEGVNPSNAFSNDLYIAENAAAAGITVEATELAYQNLGLNPLTQYATFGEAEGLVVIEVPADEQVTPYNPAFVYSLTTGADNIVTSVLNDSIDGSLTASGQVTFQSWDTIVGGSGTNTLNAAVTGGVIAPTLSSIEVMNLQDGVVGGSATTVALKGLSSLESVSVSGSGAASGFTLNNLGSLPSVSITSTQAGNTLNFTAAALSPAGQTLDIELNAVTAGALTLSDTGTNTLETVSITSSAAANTLGGLVTSALGVTTLQIDGDQNLTLGGITDANNTLRTIDASDMTGSLATGALLASSTVTGGSGDDTITSGGGVDSFTGGSGNDTFAMGANLTAVDTIDGGTGALDVISGTAATLTAFTAAAPTTNVSGIESITLNDALGGGTLTLSAIQAGIADVNLGTVVAAAQAGTVLFDSGVAANIDVGTAALASTLGAINVTVAGSALTDTLTIDNDTAATDIFGGNVVTSGVEVLTLDGTTSTTAATQTPDVVTMTASVGGTTQVNFVGNNSFAPAGVITAGTIDASALSLNLAGAQSALTMVVGANTATNIIGSAGADTLLANTVTATATSIHGGAGNDTITASGLANDTLRGGEGDDAITMATGNDSVDGGAGNDTVTAASGDITANDTVSGGEGTADVLSYTTFVAATDNAVAAQARVSDFEVLQLAGSAGAGVAVTMSNYINNTGFNTINLGTQGATGSGYSIANASSSLNTISSVVAASGTNVFDRLTDTGADSLRVQNATTGAGAASVMAAFTALDEETITLGEVAGTTAGANDLTITTLTVADLTTLNIASASDVIITNAIVGAANLATVNASTATGAVTVNASNSGTAVTMTANAASTAVNTFTGGAFADVISGGAGADVLVGGGGKDTISGNGGADAITGGTSADSMTGGTGVDTYTQGISDSLAVSASVFAGATVAAGDTLTFGNGVDVITDFVAGAGGDVVDGLMGGAPTTLIGETVAALTAITGEVFFASGSFNATTGLFTISAAGTGLDTLIVYANQATAASDNLTTNASMIVLVGVDSDNLVAGNFTSATNVYSITANSVVSGGTGLITGGAVSAANLIGLGFTAVDGGTIGTGFSLTVNGQGAGNQTYNAITGEFTGAADASFNQLAYTNVDALNFGTGTNTYTTNSIAAGTTTVAGNTGVDTLVYSGGAVALNLGTSTVITDFENINASAATGAMTATLVAGSTSFSTSAFGDSVALANATGNAVTIEAAALPENVTLTLSTGHTSDTVTVNDVVGDLVATTLASNLVVNLLDATDTAISITTGTGNSTIANSVVLDNVSVNAAATGNAKTITIGGQATYTVSALSANLANNAAGTNVTLATNGGNTTTISSGAAVTINNGTAATGDLLVVQGGGRTTINGLKANLLIAADNINQNIISTGTTALTITDNSDISSPTTIDAANLADNQTLTINTGALFFAKTITVSNLQGDVNGAGAVANANLVVTATGVGGSTIVTGSGKDTISGSGGADNITGSAGADSMTGGAGVDTFVGNLTSSVASTATTFAGATLAVGDTLTYGNRVDVITDFVAGAGGDVVDNSAAVVGAIASGLGQNVTTGFATSTTSYFISGAWDGTIFTVAANGAGADTAVVFGDATPTTLANHANVIILVGVDTDNLVAGNFS